MENNGRIIGEETDNERAIRLMKELNDRLDCLKIEFEFRDAEIEAIRSYNNAIIEAQNKISDKMKEYDDYKTQNSTINFLREMIDKTVLTILHTIRMYNRWSTIKIIFKYAAAVIIVYLLVQ